MLRLGMPTWYMAWGLQLSGSVRYRTSSQFLRLGMILKALGILPTEYLQYLAMGRRAHGCCHE